MKPTTREFSAAVVLLWVLLTGFFWLGYWVGGQERLDGTTGIRSNPLGTDSGSTRPGSEPSEELGTRKQTGKWDAPARL